MQIKLSKAKCLLEQYIHSEGRHWKAKVKTLVDDAFFAYDGRLDYLKLTWDDFGLDTIAVILQDKLDNQLGLDTTRFSDCVAGVEKLSDFVHSTYAKYEEVPELISDEIIYNIEITKKENDGEDLDNTESDGEITSTTTQPNNPKPSGTTTTRRVTTPITPTAFTDTRLSTVVDHVIIKANIQEQNKGTTIIVDVAKYPAQKSIIGKKVGESFKLGGFPLTYKITEILSTDATVKEI